MKKYSVIYADPPWSQKAGRRIGAYKRENGEQVFSADGNDSLDLPYATMAVPDIANLRVKDITCENACLYMWVTNKYLLDAKCVIEAWGFKYSTTIVWCKNPLAAGSVEPTE